MPARTELPRPIRLRRAVALAAAAVLALGLAACGDDDDDDVSAGNGDATTVTTAEPDTGSDDLYPSGDGGEAAAGTVEAIDFEFSLSPVAAGAEVTFKNSGEAPHTMTADDGAFDSGRVEPGASATVTAPAEPGDYSFHCEIHPDMKATLTVE